MMRCVKCGGKTGVTCSRERASGKKYRRRMCKECGIRFSTSETVAKKEARRDG